MAVNHVQFGFVAGELAPSLYGRTDLTKYDLAMAELYNFFVDYRGGISTRAGFEHVGVLADCTDGPFYTENIPSPKFFVYEFAPDVDYNFLGLIYPIVDNAGSEIRFIQNGRFVQEASLTVASFDEVDGRIETSAAHGYSDGDVVQFAVSSSTPAALRGRAFVIEVVDTTNFWLIDEVTGEYVEDPGGSTTYPVLGVGRLLTISTPYTAFELDALDIKQYRDTIRICHPDHPIRNLLRTNGGAGVVDEDGNAWELALEVIGTDSVGPTITTSTQTGEPGESAVLFAVTSVYADGSESIRGPIFEKTGGVNYATTAGSVSIYWDADPEAVYYNVYRSIISHGENLTSGSALGFIGQTHGTKFTDANIIPDFTRTPPERNNPFAVQPVASIEVTAGGTGYNDFDTTVTIPGAGGSGFLGEAVVDDAGEVINVTIRDPGHDFPVGDDQAGEVTFTGAGTGAAATFTVNVTFGTYPGISCVYQQRQIYAATRDEPTTLWGSQVKQFANFDQGFNDLDSTAFEFTLDTPSFASIRHLIPTQGGLLVTTQESIWVLNGGGPFEPITSLNAVAVPQTFNGCSFVHPLKIGSDLLYAEGKGHAVRLLSYNEISRVYSGDDRSILANHLFGQDKAILQWAYQESPFKLVWCVRSDGDLLAFTIVRNEDIYAWTRCGTNGQFLAVANMRENNSGVDSVQIVNDRVYVVVQRYINGRWVRMVERMALRSFTNVEDSMNVDAGVKLEYTYPDGNLNIWQEDGVWYAKSDTASLAWLAGYLS